MFRVAMKAALCCRGLCAHIACWQSSFLPLSVPSSLVPYVQPVSDPPQPLGVTLWPRVAAPPLLWAVRPPPSRGSPRRRAGCGMAAALALLGRAAGLANGARRLLGVCGVGRAAEAGCCRAMSSAERPKRPLSAYFRFLRDKQPQFRQQNPGLNSLELVKKLAGVWRELPASQKQVYEEARKTDWRKYEEQLAAYKAQLTPAQAAALKEERRKRLAKRRSFRIKRELTVLGKPKRPRSGFNIFVSENFQQSKGLSPTAKLKQLFETWQNLSASQKQPYLQLAQDDKVRYQNEMKSWEAKMIELGREDLIRSREQRPKKKTDTNTARGGSKAKLHESLAKLKLKKPEE